MFCHPLTPQSHRSSVPQSHCSWVPQTHCNSQSHHSSAPESGHFRSLSLHCWSFKSSLHACARGARVVHACRMPPFVSLGLVHRSGHCSFQWRRADDGSQLSAAAGPLARGSARRQHGQVALMSDRERRGQVEQEHGGAGVWKQAWASRHGQEIQEIEGCTGVWSRSQSGA